MASRNRRRYGERQDNVNDLSRTELQRIAEEFQAESELMHELREAGCKCERPLLGYRPNVGPRCRLCNVIATLKPDMD